MFNLQVLTLLLGRWLLGFCFPHGDLNLLDDPLPKELYCRRFREEPTPSKDVEAGLEETSIDAIDGESQPIEVNGVVTSEPTGGEDPLSARNALFGANKNSNFNITEEMDNCDLWKNLIKNYDAPPQSPRSKSDIKGDAPVITVEGSDTDMTQHQPNSKPLACRRLELYHSTAV